MLVNGLGDQYGQGCPVAGDFEDRGWYVQCPMYEQWSRQPVSEQCSYSAFNPNFVSPSVQCFRNVPPVYLHNPNQYCPVPIQEVYPRQVSYVPPAPLIPNLPCRQQQSWDYDSMCYNVDGQPCQYTAVIDLEDMM